MADQVTIMAMAIICAVAIMIWASGPVANFVNRHPTVRILALCFLLLVGMTLVADGSGYPVPKGFIYAAIAFSSLVEGLNQIARRRSGERNRRSPGWRNCSKRQIAYRGVPAKEKPLRAIAILPDVRATAS
jgi:predicted tellurium resistance membrane protein TerC